MLCVGSELESGSQRKAQSSWNLRDFSLNEPPDVLIVSRFDLVRIIGTCGCACGRSTFVGGGWCGTDGWRVGAFRLFVGCPSICW